MPTVNRRIEYVKKQGSYNRELYQSACWHRKSREFRRKNPLCKMCLDKGLTEKSDVVDHIIPLSIWIERGGDPYDDGNLQALSKRCHSIKTIEDKTKYS